jgi:hypothetical protein
MAPRIKIGRTIITASSVASPPSISPVRVATKTTFYEGTGTSNTNAPWTETDNTYDDYSSSSGLNKSSSVYHNLTPTVIKSPMYPGLVPLEPAMICLDEPSVCKMPRQRQMGLAIAARE